MKIFAVVLFAVGIIINPSGATLATKEALVVCVNSVIPALFPFFVCSKMIIEMGAAENLSRFFSPVMKPIFGVGGGGALAFVLGILSGYPIGAAAATDLVKNGGVTKSEAEKLLGYCNNSGPLFILGAIGAGMLGNASLGWMLYASHIMAAFTIALLMRAVPCKISCVNRTDISVSDKHFGEIMAQAIGRSAESVFNVCGFVIIFAIIAENLEAFGVFRFLSLVGIDYNIGKVFTLGFLEPVGGCTATKIFSGSVPVRCMVLSSIVGWSGISVHLQVLGIIKQAGLSAKYYFLGKIGMTVISPVYTYALLKLFPQLSSSSVFAPSNMGNIVPFPYISWFVCVSVIFVLILQFIPAKRY